MKKPNGLYISPTEFVRFAESAKPISLSDHIATRNRSPDFTALGMYLPNPDPILKKLGKDIRVYSDLRSDAHVGGCIRRRKAGVVRMEWRIDRDRASARMAKLCEQVLGDLDMRRVMREMLDAPLFGWQPLEVIWSPASSGGAPVPLDVLAKPAHWFNFDSEAQLRFLTRQSMFQGELLEPRKFLVPAQDASYANPYGFPDLSMCFWPTVFKRGGLKFWVTFTEKFGTPWVVGKAPRGTPPPEQDKLLDQLEAMVQDAVSVIPDDSSVEIVEAGGKSGSADLYEKLLLFCRSEISIALLGSNQTTEKDSTFASAKAGAGVADDLRDADARLVEAAMNQLLRWVVDLNEGEAAPAPKFELYEQEEVDQEQAKRDETLSRAGLRLSRAYWMRTYDLEEGDIDVAPPAPPAPSAAVAKVAKSADNAVFSEPTTPDPVGTLATELTDPLLDSTQSAWGRMLATLQTLVNESDSLAALQQAMLDAYGGLDSAELVRLMSAAMALAELKGMADAQDDGAA